MSFQSQPIRDVIMKEKLASRKPDRTIQVVPANREYECTELTRSELFAHWLKSFSETTSIHGMKWHLRVTFVPLKVFYVAMILAICISMPTYFVYEAIDFFSQVKINTAIELGRESSMKYPNVTVCFGKFFDNRNLDVEGISMEIANYITMALDPSASTLYRFMSSQIGNYAQRINELQTELDQILTSRNITIVDLMKKLAIRCERFITLCDIHGVFMFSSSTDRNELKCCGDYFNPEPFFVNTGTCFTTHKDVWEKWPYAFSLVKIWLNLHTARSPSLELKYKGSSAAERNGVFYAISDDDHPVTMLLQDPNKISRGMAAHIGLRLKKTDRTQLSSKFCFNDDNGFDFHYHVPYTKMNCEVFTSTEFLADCSHAPFYGIMIDPELNARPCEPKDMIGLKLRYDNISIRTLEKGCLPACIQTDYLQEVSISNIDPVTINAFNALSLAGILGDPNDIVIMQLHFSSFDYETEILYQEGFFVFLSQIGGWLSLVVGASVLSFFELFFYIMALLIECLYKKSLTF